MKLRWVWELVKDAAEKFIADKGPRLGAALAYYTALSLAPLGVMAVAVAGFAFGREAAQGQVAEQLRATVGTEAAAVIEQVIARSANSTHGIIATVIAVGVLLYGASSVFSGLQSALNTVWRVPGRPSSGGVWETVKEYLLSFGLVFGTAFLLVASLVVSAVISAVNTQIDGWLPGTDVLAQWVNTLVAFGLLTLLFAMIYKWLPETSLAWSDVWHGAAITAALFSVGKYLIGLYLGRAAVGSAYGAAGAFVVLLMWIHYSTQLILFGAELTFVYATRYGRSRALHRSAAPSGPQPGTVPQPAV